MSNRMGWECPKCGRVMAPFVTECPNCSKSTSVWADELKKLGHTVEAVDLITKDSGAPSKSECKSKLKSECKCHTEDKVADKFNESKIKVLSHDNKGNSVEVKDMTKEELKNLDNILEKILGNLL